MPKYGPRQQLPGKCCICSIQRTQFLLLRCTMSLLVTSYARSYTILQFDDTIDEANRSSAMLDVNIENPNSSNGEMKHDDNRNSNSSEKSDNHIPWQNISFFFCIILIMAILTIILLQIFYGTNRCTFRQFADELIDNYKYACMVANDHAQISNEYYYQQTRKRLYKNDGGDSNKSKQNNYINQNKRLTGNSEVVAITPTTIGSGEEFKSSGSTTTNNSWWWSLMGRRKARESSDQSNLMTATITSESARAYARS